MSGRSLHWRDGVLITNRKTDRRNPRTETQWVLSFDLPPYVGGLIVGGKYPGMDNVTVGPGGHIEMSGPSKGRLVDQLVEFLRIIACNGLVHMLSIYIHRKDTPARPRTEDDQRPKFQIHWNGRSLTMIHRRTGSPGNSTIESMRFY